MDGIAPRVAFVSILKARQEYRTSRSNEGALRDAIKIAARNGLSIINASFEVHSETDPYDNNLRMRSNDILLVVAAGNKNVRFRSDAEMFWAGACRCSPDKECFSQSASHDPDLKRSIGKAASETDYVDILAPGCQIPALGIDEAQGENEKGFDLSPQAVAGTSFAAPLVSYTAAILRALETLPATIKNRIVVSASVDWGLRKETWASGRLNLEGTALAYPFHVIHFSKTETTPARRILAEGAQSENTVVTLCGDSINVDKLARVSRRREGGR
jgi:subtilisin family serine protease